MTNERGGESVHLSRVIRQTFSTSFVMYFRFALALAFGLTLLGTSVLLYPRNPTAVTTGILFAVLGALCARLFPVTQKNLPSAGDAGSALTAPDAPQREHARGDSLFSMPDVAANVPAVTLLEATMDSIREGVLVVDNSLRVLASNPAARDLFSSNNGALVARRLTEVTRNPAIHAAFAVALERGERAEVKVETQAGERRMFDLQVAPLRQRREDARGGAEVRGAVGVFFDITRLEKLERVRQEFLSNVSHELRTPLTAIITFVETLEAGAIDDPENNRRFLTVIRRNSERMHTLIDDILELSAIEAGTVTVEVVPVRLHSLVNECVTSLAATAEEQRVTLFNDTAAETVVHADARRLEQMLTNLVHNAIKFNREGGEVRIGHERMGRRDRVCVSDTGEGIAPEHIGRIFERFYRVDHARSRALGGTGLGLAIVKHLARAHGGEATVRSTPNQGSTFVIELPSQVMSDE